MVLPSSTSDEFADSSAEDNSPPTSYNDDGTPSTDLPHYSFNASEYPRPIPFFGGGYNMESPLFLRLFSSRIRDFQKLMHRPPTQTEAQAEAYYISRSLAIVSYARPIGYAFGSYRAYSTRGTYKFPFVTPDPKTFDPDHFRILGRTLLEGARARYLWHFLRFTAHAVGWNLVLTPIFMSYAATTMMVAEMRDNRLKEYTTKRSEVAAQKIKEERAKRELDRKALPDTSGQGSKTAGELWREHRTQIEPREASSGGAGGDYANDASPSAMSFDDYKIRGIEDDAPVSDRPFDDQQTAQTEYKSERSRPPRGREGYYSSSQPETSSLTDGFSDDFLSSSDSPASSSSSAQSGGSGGGSSWDRIRQQATKQSPSGNSGSSRGPQAVQGRGDGYSISASDEERSFAKDDAQRDFDARIERERRGGDFEGRGR
ncbi:hypothetical protein MMC25_003540 [Agyrium rufum]|nr:hypothetical protein [Agyrium rufum]